MGIKVWSLTEFKEIREFQGETKHRGDVRRLILANGEKHLVSCALDGMYKIWQLAPRVATEAKLSLEETEQQGKDAELAALENIMMGGNEVDLLFDDAVADVCLAS